MTRATPNRGNWLADYLGLERNIIAASGAVFLLGFGEELWKRFLPKYLEALGATPVVIGSFGTATQFLDAVYQYPGGWLADHLGRRRAFVLFLALASLGYIIYLLSPSWPSVFLGLLFVMAWDSMASSAIFAVIGDALPKTRRAIGFTVQSILKRIPMVVAPLAGGLIIEAFGIVGGVRIGLVATLLLTLGSARMLSQINLPLLLGEPVTIRGIWRSLDTVLKRLLLSDILIRAAQGMVDVLVILYVMNIIGISAGQYAVLVAIQLATSILIYLPAAKLADRFGRKPFVIATFLCFALFPVTIVLASNFVALTGAFVIGGLRELGEPARKAMIVDFAEPAVRARTVGLYYLVRSLAITPAGAIGGWLWGFIPQAPFLVGGLLGFIGTLVFALTVEEQFAPN